MAYCKYLRKSRADAEAEERGEGETLERHNATLDELAKRLNLDVIKTYKEIVSGETISARPVMQELLADVESGLWDGVLVMEVERLSRGDTKDQGTVAQTFKYSDTKIITPTKTYDPSNEYDEEYFEFGLYMSRREYKTINRRLNAGRLRSVQEGKFIANRAPLGYERVKLYKEKGFSLAIVEDKAEVVKTIFEYYVNGKIQSDGTIKRLGAKAIANELNSLEIKTSLGGEWTYTAVSDILRNPVYIGKIKWGGRGMVKKVVDGNVTISRPRKKLGELPYLTEGRHERIIDDDTFYKAQELIHKNKKPTTPSKYVNQNPFAGLILCADCGKKMTRRPYADGRIASLICTNNKCTNASSPLPLIEKAILSALNVHLEKFKATVKSSSDKLLQEDSTKINALKAYNSEIGKLNLQLDNLHDLLEQGVYTKEVFTSRYALLTKRIDEAQAKVAEIETELFSLREKLRFNTSIIPSIEHLLDVYNETESIEQKQELLRSVIEKILYKKEPGGRWRVAPDEFTVEVYPKL